MGDVLVHAPTAVITVPKDISRYGVQKEELTREAHEAFLRAELRTAVLELDELRNLNRCLASMLEALVIINRRGEQPRTMDDDGTLLVPRIPLELRRERGGALTVANHPEGWLVRFRERGYIPTQESA